MVGNQAGSKGEIALSEEEDAVCWAEGNCGLFVVILDVLLLLLWLLGFGGLRERLGVTSVRFRLGPDMCELSFFPAHFESIGAEE